MGVRVGDDLDWNLSRLVIGDDHFIFPKEERNKLGNHVAQRIEIGMLRDQPWNIFAIGDPNMGLFVIFGIDPNRSDHLSHAQTFAM